MIIILIETLFKLIWKVIDLILYFAGLGFIVWALFLWKFAAGVAGIGVVLLITGLVIDFLPKLVKKKGD